MKSLKNINYSREDMQSGILVIADVDYSHVSCFRVSVWGGWKVSVVPSSAVIIELFDDDGKHSTHCLLQC